MGKIDDETKNYIDNPKVFADIVNAYIYDGEQVVLSETLEELDPTVLLSALDKYGDVAWIQKSRDKYRRLAVKSNGEVAYIIIGVEAQAIENYALPVKCMVYDAGEYDKQVKRTKRIHVELQDYKGRTKGEILWGFFRDDHLIPVITLVVNLSSEPWTGPLCLHDMFQIKDPIILSMVENYKIHLIDPHTMSDEDIEKFKTDLREVMTFIKYQKDKRKLFEMTETNLRFRNVKRDTKRMIEVCTHWRFKETKQEKEELDMCQALRELQEDAREAGREEGRESTLIGDLKSIMEAFGVTMERAFEALKVPEEKREHYRKFV